MPSLLVNIFFLLSSVFLVYFWTQSPATSGYTLQLIGLFVLFYFLNQIKGKKQSLLLNTLIFTSVILLLVTTTGGLGSPLFFLVYFLLFGASLMLGSLLNLVFTLALILFFSLLDPLKNIGHLVSLVSLLFISPLALFFGKQYLRLLESQRKIAILTKTRKRLKKAISQEETNSLIWLSLELKNGLLRIVDRASELLSQPANLGWQQKEGLEEILASSQRLLRTGDRLKKDIDETTD